MKTRFSSKQTSRRLPRTCEASFRSWNGKRDASDASDHASVLDCSLDNHHDYRKRPCSQSLTSLQMVQVKGSAWEARVILAGKYGKRKWIFFLRNSRWASNFVLLSFTGGLIFFMLYHVRMKRENVEKCGQTYKRELLNYGVWCKIHKNPQSLPVISPKKPTTRRSSPTRKG